MSKRHEDKIPFQFILDHLVSVRLVIKPMFGCYGVYTNGKLCLFLVSCEKPLTRPDGEPMRNGIYIATTTEHSNQLKQEFAEAEFDQLKGDKVWIFVSETSEKLEQYSVRACEMISAGDPLIGR